jgi:aspartate/methionine/tyrosine aminotransferase
LRSIAAADFEMDRRDFMFASSIHGSLLKQLCEALADGPRENYTALITMPIFGPFYSSLKELGLTVKSRILARENHWKLTPDVLQEFLTAEPKAKLFMFVNPGNPLGESYSKDELEALAVVFKQHNAQRESRGQSPLIVFCDEVIRNLSLDRRREFISLGSIAGMEECTFTAWSFSKDLAPGLCFAAAIGNADLIEKVKCVNSSDPGPSFASQLVADLKFTKLKELKK